MKIIYNSIIPFKEFIAINLFGVIFARKEYKKELEFNKFIINHEAIHTEQMKETLYIGFYILYLIFWIFRLLTPPLNSAYKDISFEQEAILNERNLNYLKIRKPYNWINYMFTSYRK